MSFTNLGVGYCEDDKGKIMPSYEKKNTKMSLQDCKDFCNKDIGCVAISFVSNVICQMHGAKQIDSSWKPSAGSGATEVTRSQGGWKHYSCHKKKPPIPAPSPPAPSPPAPSPPAPSPPGSSPPAPSPPGSSPPAPDLKVAKQVTEESEATYIIAGQEITQTNALVGMGAASVLLVLLL